MREPAARHRADRTRSAPVAADVGRRAQRRVPALRGRDSHRELLIGGPAATRWCSWRRRPAPARSSSARHAAALPPRCLGPPRGVGRLLRSPAAAPRPAEAPLPDHHRRSQAPPALHRAPRPRAGRAAAARAPPGDRRLPALRGHRRAGRRGGADGPRPRWTSSSTLVQDAADEEQVCFLGSDIDADGGKLMLTAGRAAGAGRRRRADAARAAPDHRRRPAAAGADRRDRGRFRRRHRPAYRRTYTVMGDVVNLAARLMAKAPPGELYATPAVLERSSTRFETTALEPFTVKGKALPVQAVSVGRVVLSRAPRAAGVPVRFPLIGREGELAPLTQALDDARARARAPDRAGSEPGMGRSRLMEEVRDRAQGVRGCTRLRAVHHRHAVRDLARAAAAAARRGLGRRRRRRARAAAGDARARRPGAAALAAAAGDALDVDRPPSPAVEQLAPEFRAARLHEVVLRFLRRQLPGLGADRDRGRPPDGRRVGGAPGGARARAAAAARGSWSSRAATARPASRRRRASTCCTSSSGRSGPAEALALAEAATEASPLPPHLVTLAAERSGGSPQFLRDLLRAAAAGSTELPDSVESAALARLDRLAPRRPRADPPRVDPRPELPPAPARRPARRRRPAARPGTWDRLGAYFKEEADGYLRFRREVVRDVAYGGLPFRVRRELHAAAAGRLERDLGEDADDAAERLARALHRAGDTPRHGATRASPPTGRASAWRSPTPPTSTAARWSPRIASTRRPRSSPPSGSRSRTPTCARASWSAGDQAPHRRPAPGRPTTRCARRTCCGCTRSIADRAGHVVTRGALVAARAANARAAARPRRRGCRLARRRDACRGAPAPGAHRPRPIRLARQAIADAEAAGEELALGHAC